MSDTAAPIRLADILSAASSLADFRLEPVITMAHLQLALRVVLGEAVLEDLGGGASPLIPRRLPPRPHADVVEFARRWNERLGGPFVPIGPAALAELRAELESPPA